jgi:hypothetical protein
MSTFVNHGISFNILNSRIFIIAVWIISRAKYKEFEALGFHGC